MTFIQLIDIVHNLCHTPWMTLFIWRMHENYQKTTSKQKTEDDPMRVQKQKATITNYNYICLNILQFLAINIIKQEMWHLMMREPKLIICVDGWTIDFVLYAIALPSVTSRMKARPTDSYTTGSSRTLILYTSIFSNVLRRVSAHSVSFIWSKTLNNL